MTTDFTSRLPRMLEGGFYCSHRVNIPMLPHSKTTISSLYVDGRFINLPQPLELENQSIENKTHELIIHYHISGGATIVDCIEKINVIETREVIYDADN